MIHYCIAQSKSCGLLPTDPSLTPKEQSLLIDIQMGKIVRFHEHKVLLFMGPTPTFYPTTQCLTISGE